MQVWNNTKNVAKDIRHKGILSTGEYVSDLIQRKNLKLNEFVNIDRDLSIIKTTDNKVNYKSFFSRVVEKFSINYQVEKKLSINKNIDINIDTNNLLPFKYTEDILGVNINDPIIDIEYINNIFDVSNLEELLSQISPEYVGTNHQELILTDYHKHLIDMFNALNNEKVDVNFIKDSFAKMYSNNEIYNGQLRGQKIRHDIMMFQQAFNRNPEKFKDIEDLIPVNLGTTVDVIGISDPRIICHSIGGIVTADSLKHAHEILIARATSAKFNMKLFVKLDQNDAEIASVLDFFSKIGGKPQINNDVSFLDEDNMTYSEWDIKNEYLRLVVPRKFAQQIIQLGNFYDVSIKITFEDNNAYEILRDFDKRIKSPKTSIEERAILIKRYNELLSYFFSKDPVLLVPSGNKSYFSPIKIFLDLSSYHQQK